MGNIFTAVTVSEIDFGETNDDDMLSPAARGPSQWWSRLKQSRAKGSAVRVRCLSLSLSFCLCHSAFCHSVSVTLHSLLLSFSHSLILSFSLLLLFFSSSLILSFRHLAPETTHGLGAIRRTESRVFQTSRVVGGGACPHGAPAPGTVCGVVFGRSGVGNLMP